MKSDRSIRSARPTLCAPRRTPGNRGWRKCCGKCLQWIGVLLGLGCVFGGCAPVLRTAHKGLPTVKPFSGTLALNVFFVQRPVGDPLLGDVLWENVDEQVLGIEKRSHLERNGFRVGVVGGHIPPALQEILALEDGATSKPLGEPAEDAGADQAASDRASPRGEQLARELLGKGPWGRYVILTPELPLDIEVKPLQSKQTVMVVNGHSLIGQTYFQSRCLLRVKVHGLGDHGAELEFIPEIHHGDYRLRPAEVLAGGLAVRQDVAVFPEMNWRTPLAPGHMVLATMRPERRGGLGSAFFANPAASGTDQLLLVVRLAPLVDQ